MSDAKNAAPPAGESSSAQIVRGGGPSWGAATLQVAETAQRWFVRSADAIHDRMHAFGGLDPTRSVKNVTGWGAAAISVDQAVQDVEKGRYGDAAFHGFVAANIAATSIPHINDAVSTALTKAPGLRHVTAGIAKVLGSGVLNPEIRAASGALKPVPLAGAAINGVMGVWAAGSRASHGDYKGAGGELVVTAASVGVYALGVVAGAALLTAGAPVLALGAAAVGAYVASEAATEIAARVYNHYAGTNVRGSGLLAVAGYAYHRVASLVHPGPPHRTPAPDNHFTIDAKALHELEAAKGWKQILDANHDGKISFAEVNAAFGKYHVKASAVDMNHDHHATGREISNALNAAMTVANSGKGR